jgi:hypothetical protein
VQADFTAETEDISSKTKMPIFSELSSAGLSPKFSNIFPRGSSKGGPSNGTV